MEYGKDYKKIPALSTASGSTYEAAPGVLVKTVQIANVFLIQDLMVKDSWFLVDAGMPGSADAIISFSEEVLPKGVIPKAIILTHGHFDHVGAIIELVQKWNIPVYAHQLEIPYLTGKKDYPEGSTLPEGIMAKLSPYYPNESINLGEHVSELPPDGTIPFLRGWRWLHTPGHTEGHISLFREEDRVMIAGDAFVTVRQESLYHVLIQDKEIHGPPQYFTFEWEKAKDSVIKLQELKPSVSITGHGKAMEGAELEDGLRELVLRWEEIAVPDRRQNM
ncbi:MBL fold metallo-hydrolase [Bacillus mangrovi]|uniref:MBL fold metallo-hydrolase n=1 Tax=Metabacillus mangrovi TaxID=1491830 RepID=A0A7X2S627_9BACI|nr:MBL fold metallo-hydrolase [Metabacillus mangrovi]MTH54348.1 MBL fold metallo-hydrolase [Metabacillus mangrovi]